MSIVYCRLYRRGQWSQDEDGHESVTDVWEILTSSETESLTSVLAASGLPAKGASHAEKTTAIVTERDADHDAEVLTRWLVNIRYSTDIKTREDATYDAQRVRGGMESYQFDEPAFYDARGYPLVNTAGDLYDGMTRTRSGRKVAVTSNFSSIPDWLFELADTLNAAAVTIHGKVYAAGTCRLENVRMADEPKRDKAGNLYFELQYDVIIRPDGWHTLLPNKGLHELVYQTRASSVAVWVDATKAAYDAKTPTTDRQIIKRRIQTTEQQDTGESVWLDANGQAQRVVTLRSTQLGTGSMSATSNTTRVTLASAGFDTTGAHVGALLRIAGAGFRGRWLSARIASVTSNTVAELESSCLTTCSGKAVWVSGAIVNQFLMPDLADWSGVPLPNNHPGGA